MNKKNFTLIFVLCALMNLAAHSKAMPFFDVKSILNTPKRATQFSAEKITNLAKSSDAVSVAKASAGPVLLVTSWASFLVFFKNMMDAQMALMAHGLTPPEEKAEKKRLENIFYTARNNARIGFGIGLISLLSGGYLTYKSISQI